MFPGNFFTLLTNKGIVYYQCDNPIEAMRFAQQDGYRGVIVLREDEYSSDINDFIWESISEDKGRGGRWPGQPGHHPPHMGRDVVPGL